VKKILVIFILFINFVFAVEIQSFRMTTNNTNISSGDVVSVIAELVTSGAVNVDTPQFPQSSGFTVLGANRSQSSSTSISIVNGRTTTERITTTRFLYQIRFDSQNSVVLPPLSLTINGEEATTNSITFNIGTAPAQESPVSVRFIRERNTLYKGEQAILTVRVQVRTNAGAQLTNEGYSNFIHGLQERLTEKFTMIPLSNSPQTSQEVINGIPHVIYDLSFNIVPTDTGRISIPAIPISYAVMERSRGRDPFESFFGSSVRQRQATASSPPLNYTIKAVPRPIPANFTGVIGEIRLSGSLSKDTVSAGEAITLRVNMSGRMPPNLMTELTLANHPDLDIFPPERRITVDTTARGINTRKTYSWMIVPRREGDFPLNLRDIVWFDPNTAQFRTASAGNFRIVATEGNPERIQARRHLTQAEIATLGDDIRYIKTAFSTNDINQILPKRTLFKLFLTAWISALILVLIKLKLVLFPKNLSEEKRSKAYSAAVRSLNKNSASEIASIIRYLSAKTGKECGSMKYDEIEKVLGERKVKKETCENLTKYFREVEMLRYASSNSQINLAKDGIEILKQIEREFK